jgi:hypothetical protein
MTLDASKSRDEALMQLYDVLVARGRPKPGSFTALDEAGQREYFRVARARARRREREARDTGAPAANLATIRAALADAALMILALDAPGADQVRLVLGSVFAHRPGVPVSVETRAKAGKLRPKLFRGRP